MSLVREARGEAVGRSEAVEVDATGHRSMNETLVIKSLVQLGRAG